MNVHRGRNVANPRLAKSLRFFSESRNPVSDDICIFISHIRIDKDAAVAIAGYIENAGFNVYLDIYDEALQDVFDSNDAQGVTHFIEKGINNCSHVMCLVSEYTVESWWVPYELGYGKKGHKELLTLTLKDTVTLPEYLQISEVILGTRSLNGFLRKLLKKNLLTEEGIYKSTSFADGYLLKANTSSHPLDNYLDWHA